MRGRVCVFVEEAGTGGQIEGGAKQLPPVLKRGEEYQSPRGHWGCVLPPAGMFAEIDPLFFFLFFGHFPSYSAPSRASSSCRRSNNGGLGGRNSPLIRQCTPTPHSCRSLNKLKTGSPNMRLNSINADLTSDTPHVTIVFLPSPKQEVLSTSPSSFHPSLRLQGGFRSL